MVVVVPGDQLHVMQVGGGVKRCEISVYFQATIHPGSLLKKKKKKQFCTWRIW